MNHHPLRAFLLIALGAALPAFPALSQDADNDLMPDSYETAFGCLKPNTVDSGVDYDADGLPSLAEYTYSPLLNPCLADTDLDLINDNDELAAGANPLDYYVIPNYVIVGDTLKIADRGWEGSLAWNGSEFGLARNDADGLMFSRISAAGAFLTPDQLIEGIEFSSTAYRTTTFLDLEWTGAGYGLSYTYHTEVQYSETAPPLENDEIFLRRLAADGSTTGAVYRHPVARTWGWPYSSHAWTGSEFGLTWVEMLDGLTQEILFTRVSAAGVKLGDTIRVTDNGNLENLLVVPVAWVWGDPYAEWQGPLGVTRYGLCYFDGLDWHDCYKPTTPDLANGFVFYGDVAGQGAEEVEAYKVTLGVWASWQGDDAYCPWDVHEVWGDGPYAAWVFDSGLYPLTDGVAAPRTIYISCWHVNPGAVPLVQRNSSDYPSVLWTGSEFTIGAGGRREGESKVFLHLFSASGEKGHPDITVADSHSYFSPALAMGDAAIGMAYTLYDPVQDQIDFSRVSLPGATVTSTLVRQLGEDYHFPPALARGQDEFGMAWREDEFHQLYPARNQFFVRVSDQGALIGRPARLTDNPLVTDHPMDVILSFPSLAWTGSEYGYTWTEQPADGGTPFLSFARLGFDSDGDGLGDADEPAWSTNPADWDSDNDGMPDGFEADYSTCGLLPLTPDSALNPDGDGLTNLQEYQARTSPCLADTDGGGENDDLELAFGRDPLYPFDDRVHVIIGTGAGATSHPYATSSHDARTQTIYLASEINLAGEIEAVALDVVTPPGQTMNNFTARLRHTTLAAYPTQNPAWESAWSTAYQGATTIAAPGWSRLDFTDPFYYNGADNLMFDLSFNNASASTDGTVNYSNPGGKRVAFFSTNSLFGDPLLWSGPANPAPTTTNKVPNLELIIAPDTDRDGAPNWWERQYWCMDATTVDPEPDNDSDLITNLDEYAYHTNPCEWDTDGDALGDGDEILTYGTDPTLADTDNDGLTDGAEVQTYHTNPLDPDTDDDGSDDGSDCAKLDPAHWSDCGICVDVDGDDYGLNCNLGPDCDDHVSTGGGCHLSCLTFYPDGDGDGYGNASIPTGRCVLPVGYVADNTDCDDSNPFAWDTCATCADADADGYFELCNRYSTGAPPLVTIGSGTAGLNYPLYTYYDDARTQVIYLPSEIGGAGIITAIALDVATIPGQVMNNFTIRMKHSELNAYGVYSWEGPASVWVTVYQNNEPRGVTGWRTFTLSTPFSYNGTSSLMMDFSFNNSYWPPPSGLVLATNSGVIRSLYRQVFSSYGYGDPLNWTGTSSPPPLFSTYIPNVRISLISSINGPDCDDADIAHWDDCGLCVDLDGDDYGTGCNLGPDCDDQKPNAWDTCATCKDDDTDGWYLLCNTYSGINGPDCSDTNTNAWNTCATCLDSDADSWYVGCNRYQTINGPDCNNANANVWDACAFCQDADADTWFVGCNRYQTINGPDCNDANTFTWNTCATCNDDDFDAYFELCNRYSGGASTPVTIGSGTGTWNCPLATVFHDARFQVIYLASEIGGAGLINSVALDVTTIPGQVMNNFTIRMKHTSLNSYSSPYSWEGPSSGWVKVYQNNEPQGATGWRTFTLSTPFDYNGADNVMVDFSFNNSSSTVAGYVRYTNLGSNRTLYYRTNSGYGDPLTWTGTSNPTPSANVYFPNLRISISATINGPDCDDLPATGPTCHAGCPDFFADADADLFGNAAVSVVRCVAPSGYVAIDTDCNDATNTVFPLAPELCDSIDNQCPGDPGYGVIDEGCVVDTDGDGLTDNDETAIYFTDPNDPDSDDDGIDDGDEVLTYNTNPNSWDTDGDYLPDPFELANAANPAGPLDANNAIDGDTDFEPNGLEDRNPNYHEFWNGSDLWAKDPAPDPFASPACYYWAEGDGDGVPGPGDLAVVKNEVATGLPTYDNVLPRGVFDTQDVDKDGVPGPGDISSVKDMVTGIDLPSGYPSMPVSLGVVSAPGGAVEVGDTCHVTVEVVNQALAVTRSGAFAVVFSIDPASTGSAVLLGGEGEDLGQGFSNRYDFSGPSLSGGLANIVLKLTAPGTVIVRAKIPACGIGTTGRWCGEVVLSPAVTVMVE